MCNNLPKDKQQDTVQNYPKTQISTKKVNLPRYQYCKYYRLDSNSLVSLRDNSQENSLISQKQKNTHNENSIETSNTDIIPCQQNKISQVSFGFHQQFFHRKSQL
jgi:3-polyprenyl-4-hydroxybenzoate decarboxylase